MSKVTLELAYTNDLIDFRDKIGVLTSNYPELEFYAYNESNYKEKKKAYKLKGGYSARLCPFVLFKIDDKVIPFYSESHDCTIDNISEILNRYLNA